MLELRLSLPISSAQRARSLINATSCRSSSSILRRHCAMSMVFEALKGHGFTGCGKTRFREALYQGTTSVVPISPLFLMFQADFSPRGTCLSDFFRSLFSRAIQVLYYCHSERASAREGSAFRLFPLPLRPRPFKVHVANAARCPPAARLRSGPVEILTQQPLHVPYFVRCAAR